MFEYVLAGTPVGLSAAPTAPNNTQQLQSALVVAKSFIGEIVTLSCIYSYLNNTTVVQDAYKTLSTIEALITDTQEVKG